MRVCVDAEICQGHTLCNMTDPEVFHLHEEDGHAYVEDEQVPAGHEDAVRVAAETCPEQAIKVEE